MITSQRQSDGMEEEDERMTSSVVILSVCVCGGRETGDIETEGKETGGIETRGLETCGAETGNKDWW